MNFSKSCSRNASLYVIRCKLKIFIHSFISYRLPCPMVIVLRYLNPVEYIQKIIISVLTVPLDEKNYEVRHIL